MNEDEIQTDVNPGFAGGSAWESDGSDFDNQDQDEYDDAEQDTNDSEEDDLPAPLAEARLDRRPHPDDAPSVTVAPSVNLPNLSENDRDRFNEMLATDPLAAMDHYVSYRLAQAEQARAVQDWHIQQIQEVAPDFVRVHGPTIQRAMSQLPPQVRATQEGAHSAIAFALLEEMNQTKDPVGVLTRAAQLMAGKGAKRTPQAQGTAPIPPSQRVPSPSTGSGTVRSEGRRAPQSESVRFLKSLGVSGRDADRLSREI